VRIAPLTEATFEAWATLMAACGSNCFCRYWHFEGGKNDWLARCFERPVDNCNEQRERVAQGSLEARGLLAFAGGDAADDDPAPGVALGWLKLAPRANLVKLRRQGAYRSLDLGPDEGVWSVGCFLVHPQHRHRGIARELLKASEWHVRQWGGQALEAYPHRAAYALREEEAFMGPEALLVQCGFHATQAQGPYPVYRRSWGPGGGSRTFAE
jgi:GNAT superfamily N-acetyltransferase